MQLVDIAPEEYPKVLAPNGCAKCGQIGFKGRKAIFEMMTMNSEIRDLAFNRAPIDRIRDAAIRGGMRPLVSDGKLKVLRGITTAEEVARFAQADALLEANVDI
jgi:type II secretory ATPase GspE/PulE/Tfp pilus assembly ATPase PilB-like protein